MGDEQSPQEATFAGSRSITDFGTAQRTDSIGSILLTTY
jgi:hypothetical protein